MSVDDDQPEVLFRAKLQRESGDIPWGFRLQGGVEFDTPLTVLKVTADSVASRCGLNAGDIVVRLCGQAASAMTHLMAQQAIANSGNTLEIIVQRAEVTLPSQQVVPESLANNIGMLPIENYQVLNNGSMMTMDTISQTMPNTSSSVVSRQPSGMRSTSASVELIRDVSIVADDVIINHSQRNDDDQNPRNTRQYVQQPRQRTAGDVISGQQGHSLVSRHSNIPATRNDEMTSSRIRQPTSGSRDKRVHGGGSVGTVFCSSRTDDDDEIERQIDRSDVTTITEKQHFNIPVTSFGDKQMKHLHPVEALVSTDAVSRDYPGFGSIADSSSDSVSDCASEISDDVASVIEMPITSATSGDGDPRDGGRFGKDGACDDTESGISPDYDSFDDCSFLPAQQADGVGYFRPVFSPKSESERGRSPTPTPDDDTSRTTASSTTPTPVTSGCNDQSNSAVRNENTNGGTIADDSVFGNRINFNAQDQRGDGGTRRDFSQTAPWRVSGSQQRSAMSLLSAAGTSISDPDITSSSASADRIATSKLMVINRRPCSRRSPASEVQAQPPGDSYEAQLGSSGGQEPNVVHIPISYGSTSSSPAVGTRVAATVSIVPVTDRPSSQAAIPPTNSGSKSSVREPVTAAAASVPNPRCYIPQKPPPIPMPASVGPEPRSSLRAVRSSSTATGSESNESDQPKPSKPCPPVATRRWTDDETDRRVRRRDDTKVGDYVDEQADLPKRPVREMVAELNNRLERCERSAVDGVEAGSPLDSPYGSRYDLREAEAARGRRRSSSGSGSGSGSDSEREIIIDTPPASMTSRFSDDDQSVLGFSQRTLVDSKSDASQLTSSVNKRRPVIITPTVSYHGTIVYSTPSDILQQLSPRSARRFSLPTSSASSSSSSVASFIHPQRKVRFAEPPESSVIEIESSRRRRPAASGGVASLDVVDGDARPPLAADWRRTRQRSWISARHQQQPHQQPLVRSADEDGDVVDRDGPNVWNEDSPSTDDVEYGSVTSLSEKLDRIELEHALASAAMRRSRPYQQQPQQPQQQQQSRHQASPDPSTIVGATNLYIGDGSRPHQQRQASTSGKLEPINERIISIQQPTPTDYSTFYDDNDNDVGVSAGPTPIVGGLRYLFRRRSNADVTRLMSQRGDASSGGGFSVSIGPSASGGGRLSLLVQQTSPGTRVNLVFPSSTSVGHSFARGSDGGERVTYSIASTSPSSSGSGNRSMPPTYEESVRGTAVPSPGQHHHHHRHHQRSPSAQDFSPAAAAGIFPGVIRHQQQQLVVPSMPPNSGQSSPTAQAGYSQTLQVDTGLRQYQPSPTSSSSSPSLSPRHSTPQCDPSTPVFVGQPSGLNRSPIPLGRHLAERQARLELARSRPHSGDLDLTTPGASGQQFNTGRCSSPLILSPTGPPGRQLIPAPLSAIMPDRPWPGSHRLTSPPEIVNHQNASPITFLPVSPQTALTSPLESMPPNYSGVLAFLDKTFTDKILSWQAQRSRDGTDGTDGGQLQQSETYKLVREMDEQQYRRSDHF